MVFNNDHAHFDAVDINAKKYGKWRYSRDHRQGFKKLRGTDRGTYSKFRYSKTKI